jgi:guanine deaminase
MDERAYLQRAIDLALENVAAGDQPFGAVVVAGGEVVGEGVNRVERTGDPTDHAEVAAIRAACLASGLPELPQATLYSSCRPCPMCQATALLVGVGRTLYAAGAESAARAGFSLTGAAASAQALLTTAEGARIEQLELPGAEDPFEAWLVARNG